LSYQASKPGLFCQAWLLLVAEMVEKNVEKVSIRHTRGNGQYRTWMLGMDLEMRSQLSTPW